LVNPLSPKISNAFHLPFAAKELTFMIEVQDYISVIKAEAAIQVYAIALVKETNQRMAQVQKYALKKPDLQLSVRIMFPKSDGF
jgi:hypothetical protein